jgi:hypothetical protein
VNAYEIVSSEPTTSSPPGGLLVTVACPDGKNALGGGYVQTPASINAYVYVNAPLPDGSGWQAAVYHDQGDPFTIAVTTWAICAR